MAYYDRRTGKRVDPPMGGWILAHIFFTILGIAGLSEGVEDSIWMLLLGLSPVIFAIIGVICGISRKNNVNNNVHDTVTPVVAKEAAKPKRDTLDTALDLHRTMDIANSSLRMIEQQKQEEKALSALATYLKQFPVKNQLEFINYLKQCPEGKRQEILQKILREYGTADNK